MDFFADVIGSGPEVAEISVRRKGVVGGEGGRMGRIGLHRWIEEFSRERGNGTEGADA
jgi:hypothetical protein